MSRGPRVAVRPARPGDLDRLTELCGQLGYPAVPEEVARRLTALSGRPDHAVLVAVDEADRPVAWVHVGEVHRLESGPFAEVGGLVVDEPVRGSGIGGRLMAEAEAWARERGVLVLRVRSNVTRTRTHEFYARLGYSRRKTSHVFEKSLAEAIPDQGEPESSPRA